MFSPVRATIPVFPCRTQFTCNVPHITSQLYQLPSILHYVLDFQLLLFWYSLFMNIKICPTCTNSPLQCISDMSFLAGWYISQVKYPRYKPFLWLQQRAMVVWCTLYSIQLMEAFGHCAVRFLPVQCCISTNSIYCCCIFTVFYGSVKPGRLIFVIFSDKTMQQPGQG